MYTKNFWMNVPHSIWKALSIKAFIFHSVLLSESQLCFLGCVSLSTWHSADKWKQHVSGTLSEILEHMKFPLSIRENLHLERMVKHGKRLPRQVETSTSLEILKTQLGGQSTGSGWPRLSQPVSGGIGPALETSSSLNWSEYLWVYSNYCLLKLLSTTNQFKRKSHSVCL